MADDARWNALAGQGAQRQRLLWASTSTKDPAYDEFKYVDALIAPDTVTTLPMATLIWLYTWYFQWRSLIVPPVNPTDPLDRLEMKARALRWNVETIGFSPNGFTAYFLFKILMVIMVGMIFIQAWTFFFRSYLEFVEGEESEGKYLDRDKVETGEEAYDHAEF